MKFEEYREYDGLGLAALVRNKEVSAETLLDVALERAQQVNPKLNAIVHIFIDEAKRQLAKTLADNSAATFAGVPFLLKDLLPEYAGQPMTKGTRGIHLVPEQDDELVKRFKAAGLISFAKTNCPELGLALTTESKALGAAHNPWKLGYSTGGSSGGSAASVAAAIVPLAQADDGGGSIRYPAACNGVFGLKPSRGRTPLGPNTVEWWEGAVVPHCVSRSVRDSAALLDCIAGPEVGGVYHPSPVESSYSAAVDDNPKKLRVAVCEKLLVGSGVDADVRTALEKTEQYLVDLGHEVERVDTLPVHDEDYWRWFITVVAGYVAAEVRLLVQRCGKQVATQLEPATKSMVMIGEGVSAADLVMAKYAWRRAGHKMEVFHQQYDVLLQPTMPNAAQPHGVLMPTAAEEIVMTISSKLPLAKLALSTDSFKNMSEPMMRQMGFANLANMTGQPSMSVPLHCATDGLPIGMMFTAAYSNEYLLYQLAGQLEKAYPWNDRRPPI